MQVADNFSCDDESNDSSNEVSVESNQGYRKTGVDILALGITIALGGQFLGFNRGFSAGFGSFLIATILMGSAYICLIMCTSEIVSGLPFAGGAYGLTRCAFGFYPGYCVGCCDFIEYVIYTSLTVSSLANLLTDLFQSSEKVKPIYWLLLYSSAMFVQIRGGFLFWRTNSFLALISLLIVAIYFFGSLENVDISSYAITTQQEWFVDGGFEFMKVFSLSAGFYMGVESLAFACGRVKNPKVLIPRGGIMCVFILFWTSVVILFTSASLPPGIEATTNSKFPLAYGFSLIFGISSRLSLILIIPAMYASMFGFIYSYGELIRALAGSKLLPQSLAATTFFHRRPYFALTAGSVIGYCFCLLRYFIDGLELHTLNICFLASFISYIFQLLSYIQIKRTYSSVNYSFNSPFGVYGAIYALGIFTLGIISIVGFQVDQYALIVVAGLTVLFTIYYFTFAIYRQTFSEDEQKILFVAHVKNFNDKRRSSLRMERRSSIKIVPLSVKLKQPAPRDSLLANLALNFNPNTKRGSKASVSTDNFTSSSSMASRLSIRGLKTSGMDHSNTNSNGEGESHSTSLPRNLGKTASFDVVPIIHEENERAPGEPSSSSDSSKSSKIAEISNFSSPVGVRSPREDHFSQDFPGDENENGHELDDVLGRDETIAEIQEILEARQPEIVLAKSYVNDDSVHEYRVEEF